MLVVSAENLDTLQH